MAFEPVSPEISEDPLKEKGRTISDIPVEVFDGECIYAFEVMSTTLHSLKKL